MARLASFAESAYTSAQGASYEDRVRRGAYKSPAGTRIEFDCLVVSRQFTARGTAFEFDGIDQAYVQRRGISSRRYPMACIFSGPTHDLEATAFEDALSQPGMGTLEHPLYGTFKVTPFGDIGRNNELSQDANRSVVEVVFWTSTGTPYPTSQVNLANEIQAALGSFDVEAAQRFNANMNLLTEGRRAGAKATVKRFLADTSAALQAVSDDISGVRREISDAQNTVNRAIDVLVGQPVLLARQIVGLIRAPARALSGIESRLAGYHEMALELIGSALAVPAQTLAAGMALERRHIKIANDFHTADLFLTASVAGAVDASLQHQFSTKREALESAESVTELFNQVMAWRDDGFESLEALPTTSQQVDTGETYQQLLNMVSLTTGRLVEISFTLFPERFVVLDRARTIIDLSAELYGRIDNETIDYLVETNSLTGDEILEVPKGRKIAYYRT